MSDQASGLLSPWLREQRLRVAMPLLELGQILDYGCGVGSLADYVPPHRYFGVDSDEDSVEGARSRYPQHRFMTGSEFRVWRKSQKVDVVAGLALIEHLEHPVRWLSEMRELLTQEGRIVLTTPHPAGRRAHELGARMGLFSRAAAEEHTTLADVSLMEQLAAQSDLRVVQVRRFLFGWNQLFVLVPS